MSFLSEQQDLSLGSFDSSEMAANFSRLFDDGGSSSRGEGEGGDGSGGSELSHGKQTQPAKSFPTKFLKKSKEWF